MMHADPEDCVILGIQETKTAVSRVAGVADDVASDVRDNAEPTADAAADKIQAVAHESGQQIKRVADVASKQVQSVHFSHGLNDYRYMQKVLEHAAEDNPLVSIPCTDLQAEDVAKDAADNAPKVADQVSQAAHDTADTVEQQVSESNTWSHTLLCWAW
jgi:uncharacterized protein with PhoU and TrkA domain